MDQTDVFIYLYPQPKSTIFIFINLKILRYSIINYIISPSFPHSESSHISFHLISQMQILFFVNIFACIYVYLYTYIFLDITFSDCLMLLVCEFSGLTMWYWITNGVLVPGKEYFTVNIT